MLVIDASGIGVGGVLIQQDKEETDHLLSFYSRKLKYQKRYSTMENETLDLIFPLQHFEVYVNSGSPQ